MFFKNGWGKKKLKSKSNMYRSDPNILKKYADVLVKFALGSGKGIKKGETVYLQIPESAKPMLNPLILSVLEAGGNPIINYLPEGSKDEISVTRLLIERSGDKQLSYAPKNYLLGRVKDADHMIGILSQNNPKDLQGIDGKRIMDKQKSLQFYREAMDKKEDDGKFTWTLALFGTEAMAKEAGLSLESYWKEIIKACYLDKKDPIGEWKKNTKTIEDIRKKLSDMKIEKLSIKGKDTDLIIGIGKDRKWLGGGGRNIPSFEIFVSPNKWETEGYVKFSEPLYVYDNLVKDVELTFEKGKVINVKASEGEKLIKEMVKVKGANYIGEFSLTDKRFSKITHFMAETLFDENVGGKFGNFHLALGKAYKESFTGDVKKLNKEMSEKLGFNESVVHTDIVSTNDKTVTAFLSNGTSKVIYEKGQFTV